MTRVADWAPRLRQWDWRAYLTDEERKAVAAAETRSSEAKRALAEATAALNPIRNRAVQRAKYQARIAGRAALQSTGGGEA